MYEIMINNIALSVKEWNGKRVVTLKDIDEVHCRPEGTAKRNFNANQEHFIEGEDYYVIKPSNTQKYEIRTFEIPNRGLTLLTESGYLMLVKSFTDDLAWDVQRQLVNGYFRAQQMQTVFADLSPQLQLLINIETKQREQQKAIEDTNRRIDNIGEVISLDVHSWRKDAHELIVKIANNIGNPDSIKDVYTEIYRLVDDRAGVSLQTRLTNKRNRMAAEGVCKSKRDKLTKVDIIADDKKLIEIYLTIVKEMAIRQGIC